MRALLAFSVAALALVTSTSRAAEHGTAEEARAMLQRAVLAIEADEPAALAAITAGDPSFREKDLYVFCGGEDGRFSAHGFRANSVGEDLRNMVDKGGRPIGEEIYRVAKIGEVHTVEYSQARPGDIAPSWKVAYVTKVTDQICAVGYYK